MYRKEVNAKSPLRILENSIHGGLGQGNLGVVMSRAGAGKSALLVQIGLDDLMREKKVLHVALGQKLEHAQCWYDALFDDLARYAALEDREAVRAQVMNLRMIQAYAERTLAPERLEQAVDRFHKHLGFTPSAILVDGFDWEGQETPTEASLSAFKRLAQRLGAELWISAQTHRAQTSDAPRTVVPPCAAYERLIDVALFLEPHGEACTIRILKDHGHPPAETHLVLHTDTMRISTDSEPTPALRLPPSAYTLLSGGAQGAEVEFGALAEKYGMHELTFSFEGRTLLRDRGLVLLSDDELKQGEVSEAYVAAQMHRNYPSTPQFKKMLQTIWHQVTSAGEVFVVGTILSDGTVKGGTGWAAELAKHWNRSVYVFDQEKRGWFSWTRKAWARAERPVITKTRFTGTGTRFLSDDGREAIRALFERSFGAP